MLSDDDMILHFYGESGDPDAIERALATDPDLRARYERLKRELEALPKLEVPEPAADLAARVWSGIRPELKPHRSLARFFEPIRAGWQLRPGFALAAAATLALAAGILIGRRAQEPVVTPAIAEAPALSVEARERLLFASVGEHLDGSARLLTTIANSGDAKTLVDERDWAASLAVTNRLYRTAAERAGQRKIVALLDELEPLLLELAHAPADSKEELSSTQQRIDRTDLLFKLRVAGDRLERTPKSASVSRTPTATS